jgi:plasmid stabilization system protein ParE
MSRRFILSSPASHDLDEILSYVLENIGEQRAEHVAERLYDAFQKLADNPGLGHRREDLTPSPVLFFSVWSWLVIYMADKKPLEVARVVHAARDVEALLRNEPP